MVDLEGIIIMESFYGFILGLIIILGWVGALAVYLRLLLSRQDRRLRKKAIQIDKEFKSRLNSICDQYNWRGDL